MWSWVLIYAVLFVFLTLLAEFVLLLFCFFWQLLASPEEDTQLIEHNRRYTSHPWLHLDGLQGAAEQHVVGGDQCAYWVVMGTDGIDFLQGLDVPHLHKEQSSEP